MTDNELKELVASLAVAQQKTDAQLAKTDAQLAKTDAQLAEFQKKSEARFERLEKGFEKLQKNIDHVTTQLGGIGNIQGDVAEDLFRRNIAMLLTERGISIDRVKTKFKTDNAEYDIVAINGNEVVVLEVKNRLTSHHIRHFINKQLPKFKHEHPTFTNHKLYGAVGSLVFPEQLERQAAGEGLFVFTQTKDGASIVNPENFQAKEF